MRLPSPFLRHPVPSCVTPSPLHPLGGGRGGGWIDFQEGVEIDRKKGWRGWRRGGWVQEGEEADHQERWRLTTKKGEG